MDFIWTLGFDYLNFYGGNECDRKYLQNDCKMKDIANDLI